MPLTNHQLAELLREQANRLAREGGSVYRVRALRRAAVAVLGLPGEASELLAAAQRQKLESVPGIGRGIARAIRRWVQQSTGEAHSQTGQACRTAVASSSVVGANGPRGV